MDRLQLETASPQEQVFMKVEYANRRLDYAKSLLEKNEEEIAFATLLKAQNYLNQAAVDVLKQDSSSSVKERVSRAVIYHSDQLKNLAPKVSDAHRAQLDSILSEHENLVSQLHTPQTKNWSSLILLSLLTTPPPREILFALR